MDFRQFRYFVTTAEELHMARAAERLGIAQPALSQQIKSLETQLGTRLFLRTKRRIELTDAGLALFQEARHVLEHAERAVRLARDIGRGEAGHIDIGIVGSAMFDRPFPLLLTAFRKERPEVRLAVHELPILQQIEALPNRGLDIAIVRSPLPQVLPDEVDHFVLSRQRLLVAIPLSHPLAKTPSISLSDLADDDFLFGPEAPLQLDSLDALQVSMAIKKVYGQRLPDSKETRRIMTSVGSLAEHLAAFLASRPA